jgi:glycosyltransferase involved in cell wall biosynthesis
MPERVRQPNRVPLQPSARALERPRVLFLSSHLPWPPFSGGRRRELELIKRLGARFDVCLVVVSKTAEQDRANAQELTSPGCQIEVFAAAAPTARASAGQAAHQVLRHRSPAASRRVREIIAGERVDLIHVEGFYLMQHVPVWAHVPVLLVEQNIEYELDRQRAHAGGQRVTRLDWFSESVHTHTAERACWQRATHLATVTWEDRELIRSELPDVGVSVVPDGADHLPIRPGDLREDRVEVNRPRGHVLTLLANFGYAPNVDAALHLCRDILPAIQAAIDDVHVWLVGNAPPPDIQGLAGLHVTVTGYVDDVRPFLDAADLVVCPLRIGGGVKVKMIEALRRGKAIVSSSIGAQGLPTEACEALMLADDPAGFARAVITLLGDGPRRGQLERRAADAAAMLPSWDESAAVLTMVYDELLDRETAERGRRKPARSHLAGRSA